MIRGFELYSYFGRIVMRFPIADNELHHAALARAQQWAKENSHIVTWLRVYR